MEVAALGLKVDGIGNIDKATTSLSSLAGAAKNAESSSGSLGKTSAKTSESISGVGRSSESSSASIHKMSSAAINAAAAIGVAFSASALVGYVDSWSDMQSKVGAATGDMAGAAGMMQRIADIANASYSPIKQTADVYARNVAVFRDLGKSAEEAADFTEAVNHALVITATKGMDAEMVVNALSRSMARGKLDTEAFDSIVSRSPRVLKAFADEIGTTVSALRQLAVDGKVTSDVMSKGMVNALAKVSEEAGAMPATMSDSFVRVQNNITAIVGTLDKAAGTSGNLAAHIIKLSDSAKEFTKNAEAMSSVITAIEVVTISLASVLTARLLTSVYASTIAFYQNTIAARAKAVAEVDAAKSASVLAANNLIQAKTAYVAAAATAALGATARISSVAMSLLGGPLGVVMLAATAIAYFATKQTDAEKSSMALDERIQKLAASFDGLTAAQARGAIKDYNEKIKETERDLAKANGMIETFNMRIKQHPSSEKLQEWKDRIIDAERAADDARQTIKGYTDNIEKLNAVIEKASGKGSSEDVSKTFAELNETLKERLALVGKVTEAEKLSARISGGFVKDLKPGEGDKLVAIQREIDLKEALINADKKRSDEKKTAEEESNRARKSIENDLNNEISAIERAAKVWGMSADEIKIYEMSLKGLEGDQREYVETLLKQNSAREAEKETLQSYLGLIEELRTEDERRLDTLSEQLAVMDMMKGLTDSEIANMTSRMADAAYKLAPMPSGIDVDSGPLGEMDKLNDAEDQLNDWYSSELERLERFRAERSDLNEEWNKKETEIKERHEKGLANIERARWQTGLHATQEFLGQIEQLKDSDSKRARRLARDAAIFQATINMYTAASGAYASAAQIPLVGHLLAPAAEGIAYGIGLAHVNSLRGMAHDGVMSIPKSGSWFLEKGERVTTKNTSAALDTTLDRVNKGLDNKPSGGVIVNLVEDASRAGQVSKRQGGDGKEVIDIVVSSILGDGEVAGALRQKYNIESAGW